MVVVDITKILFLRFLGRSIIEELPRFGRVIQLQNWKSLDVSITEQVHNRGIAFLVLSLLVLPIEVALHLLFEDWLQHVVSAYEVMMVQEQIDEVQNEQDEEERLALR